MSTGDLHGNLQRLLRELRAIKYPADVDDVGLRLGDPVALLPLLNFALLKFSRHVARFIVRHGFELAGKTDQRFVESCFKLFRDVLNVRTVLTSAQFFEHGFAERKVMLLCDVIAVCKKLHNEEVRQERLAALKATRQDQSSTRLAAPRRASPQVKVVRNEDIEIQQVLVPQHLPNASDGSQSVYKTKKIVLTACSPSPSSGIQPTSGKSAHRQQSPPNPPFSSSQGPSLELTFRPGVYANAGPGVQRQASAPPPIHAWFMNPAFAEDEGASDLGFGPGIDLAAAGRPDSSAWWRPAPRPEQQAAPAWNVGASQGAASAWPNLAAGSGDGGAASGSHLSFGRQPAATSTTPAAPHGNFRQATSQLPTQQQHQPERGPPRQHEHATAVALQRSSAGVAASRGGPAVAQGSSSPALPSRDLDEWSFSKFFGPGKLATHRNNGPSVGDDDTDDSSQHAADTEDGEVGAQGENGVAGGGDDLERDGPTSDQDQRFGPARHGAPHIGASERRTTGPSPTRQQHPQAGAANAAAAGSSGLTGGINSPGAKIDWQSQLAKLERETQQQVQQLKNRLASTEQELEKTRLEARQSRDALQARVTVLEGRVRFLECELELCVKCEQSPSPARNPGQQAVFPGAPSADPSLAWNSPGRPRSADSAALHHSRALPPYPSATSHTAAAAAAAAPQPDRNQSATTNSVERANTVTAAAVGSAASGFAAPGTSQTRTVQQPPDSGRGGQIGLRWEAQSVVPPTASSAFSLAAYPQHSSSGTVGGLAVQAGSSFRAPPLQQPRAQSHSLAAAPVTAQPSVPPGPHGEGYRALPSFSPMPQPGFSFQPSNLMHQVASVAAGPPQQQQQQHRPTSHLYGSSLDNSTYATAGLAASLSGLNPEAATSQAEGHASLSVDAESRHPALSSMAVNGANAGAAAAQGDAGSADARSSAWGGAGRFTPHGTLATSILKRAATGEIAAESGLAVAQQQWYRDGTLPLAGTDLTGSFGQRQQSHKFAVMQPSSANPAAMSHVPANLPELAMPLGADGGAGRGPHGAAAPSTVGVGLEGGADWGPSAPAVGAVGSDGGPRDTADFIKSLHDRYTAANAYLQTLRKH